MFKGAKSHTLDGATYLSEAPKKKKSQKIGSETEIKRVGRKRTVRNKN